MSEKTKITVSLLCLQPYTWPHQPLPYLLSPFFKKNQEEFRISAIPFAIKTCRGTHTSPWLYFHAVLLLHFSVHLDLSPKILANFFYSWCAHFDYFFLNKINFLKLTITNFLQRIFMCKHKLTKCDFPSELIPLCSCISWERIHSAIHAIMVWTWCFADLSAFVLLFIRIICHSAVHIFSIQALNWRYLQVIKSIYSNLPQASVVCIRLSIQNYPTAGCLALVAASVAESSFTPARP